MSLNKQAFWKSHWFLGLLLTLLFCFSYAIGVGPLKSLEFVAYDTAISASTLPADSRIVIVDIDNESIDRLGRWPWPRSIVADAINILSKANARLIGVDIFFSEKQQSQRNNQVSLQLAELLRQQGKDAEAAKIEAETLAMDEDYLLSKATKDNGNTYMPIFFDAGAPLGNPDADLPAFLAQMNIRNVADNSDNSNPISAVKLHYPFDQLAAASAGLGFLNVQIDSDGVLRTDPLVVKYYGKFLPSMSLAMAARNLNLTVNDIRINLGSNIELGALDIGSDPQMRIYPAFHGNGDGFAFKHYPFHEVLSGRIPPSIFKDKIVLIGVTGTGLGETYVTPVSNYMPGVEFHANVLQSILEESFYSQPSWANMVQLLLIIIVGLYLMFLLPRLNITIGTSLTVIFFISLLTGNFLLLVTASLWLQTMTAAALLLVGHVIIETVQHFSSEEARDKMSADSAETNKMLGLSFQSQGMLDMAFDKFRKCPINDDILQCIYNLALDFERKRQFNKASAVYEYITEHKPAYKDTAARIERMRSAGDTMIFGGSTSGGGMSTLLITGGAKPTLGRYEIIRELGKGAMGTVYLGKDPKINREVAIKTMALAQEFEADEMEEVKERFFREAETAGMLNHPNIVTIYDAGDEHDLAYIAMEFLDGSDLSPYTKKGKLFPAAATMKICGKVAEALNYAQSQNVVHRDIKPANIMLLKDKTIKVTDFGIARITASSKTKTGVVLGTPSYMSPEQLSGKHVDGRSDIFSLGVMMYEMLSGARPFRGDSMATLMFQIANEPHPDIREHNSAITERTAKLLDHMLSKDPATRIPNGAAVVREIIQCLREMAAQGPKK